MRVFDKLINESKPMSKITLRPGKIVDAPLLAKLVNYAGEGLPLYLWEQMAEEGQTAWDIGQERASRESGSFSYQNTTIIEYEGQPAGSLIGYEIAKTAEPIGDDLPPMFVPLLELENLALDTWYVNVLAVLPEFRNLGLGSTLLKKADEIGASLGKAGMSVIVADKNTNARKLYERFQFKECAQRPMVKEGWLSNNENWVLMTKHF